MNKIVALSLLSGAMLMVPSVFATPSSHHNSGNLNLGVVVGNDVTSTANSGDNLQLAGNLTNAQSGNNPMTFSRNNSHHSNGGNTSATGTQVQGMNTGDATAVSMQTNVVNGGCGCNDQHSRHSRPTSTTNVGVVWNNDVSSTANTGSNFQGGLNVTNAQGSHGNTTAHGTQVQLMSTGDAYAESDQWNLVNSSVTP